MPKYAPQNISCGGIVTSPPAPKAADNPSTSSTLSASTLIEKLFPGVNGVPGIVSRPHQHHRSLMNPRMHNPLLRTRRTLRHIRELHQLQRRTQRRRIECHRLFAIPSNVKYTTMSFIVLSPIFDFFCRPSSNSLHPLFPNFGRMGVGSRSSHRRLVSRNTQLPLLRHLRHHLARRAGAPVSSCFAPQQQQELQHHRGQLNSLLRQPVVHAPAIILINLRHHNPGLPQAPQPVARIFVAIPSPDARNSLNVLFPLTIMSRISSSDHRSPNLSKATLTGHPDRRFALIFFTTPMRH